MYQVIVNHLQNQRHYIAGTLVFLYNAKKYQQHLQALQPTWVIWVRRAGRVRG